MNLVTSIVLGLVRLGLAGTSAWLMQKGVINQNQVGELASGVGLFVLSAGWTVWNKINARIHLLTALAQPSGTSINELKVAIAAGNTASVATPNSSAPRIGMAVLLVATLGAGAIGLESCAGTEALTTSSPTATQVDATRKASIQVADETGFVLNVIRQIRQACQDDTKTPANPSGSIGPADMNSIDQDSIALGKVLNHALDDLKLVTSAPSLQATARTVIDGVDRWLAKIPLTGAKAYLVPIARGALAVTRTQIGG